ncbi:MAG: cell wall hydrolase [Lachnospiraceae bacterium]|nr:cell wall hydrolase [Lachnospiraceae bacterium]
MDAPEESKGMIWSMDWDSEDAYLLAKIAMAEAEGEDVEGKALVILVVLNRVWSDKFPDSIPEVIFQKRQFSPVGNGRFDRVEPNRECYEALELIQLNKWDESQGALYFESEGESSWHRDNLHFIFRHGNHYFYIDKELEE